MTSKKTVLCSGSPAVAEGARGRRIFSLGKELARFTTCVVSVIKIMPHLSFCLCSMLFCLLVFAACSFVHLSLHVNCLGT